MEEPRLVEEATTNDINGQLNEEERDPESNSMRQPLLKRNRTLSSSPFALVGAKVSHIESLDYEINENDLFKHDWRRRSRAQVLQYVFLKWSLAFLVGLLTGVTATLINLAIENIAGYKLRAVVNYIDDRRYLMGFAYFAGANFVLTLIAALLCVCFAPTAAGPGIPEIKAYLNGVDTPNMFGATTLFVKVCHTPNSSSELPSETASLPFKVGVRSAYTLPSSTSTCGITLGMMLSWKFRLQTDYQAINILLRSY